MKNRIVAEKPAEGDCEFKINKNEVKRVANRGAEYISILSKRRKLKLQYSSNTAKKTSSMIISQNSFFFFRPLYLGVEHPLPTRILQLSLLRVFMWGNKS